MSTPVLDTRHVMNALLHPSQNKFKINIGVYWCEMNAGLVSRTACGRNRILLPGVSAGDIHREGHVRSSRAHQQGWWKQVLIWMSYDPLKMASCVTTVNCHNEITRLEKWAASKEAAFHRHPRLPARGCRMQPRDTLLLPGHLWAFRDRTKACTARQKTIGSFELKRRKKAKIHTALHLVLSRVTEGTGLTQRVDKHEYC